MDFKNKWVLVTGSNSNVGSAIVNGFAAAGANVIRHSRLAQSPLQRHEQNHRVTGDLTNPEDVASLFRTVESLGSLDVLINNVGAYPSTPIGELSMDQWRSVIAANLDSTFGCLQQAARLMAKSDGGPSSTSPPSQPTDLQSIRATTTPARPQYWR